MKPKSTVLSKLAERWWGGGEKGEGVYQRPTLVRDVKEPRYQIEYIVTQAPFPTQTPPTLMFRVKPRPSLFPARAPKKKDLYNRIRILFPPVTQLINTRSRIEIGRAHV